MMKRLAVLLCMLLLASPALALDIFYPADGTYVVNSDFLIIKAGENVAGLTLEIGGEKSDLLDISSAEYKAAFGDMLIVQPNWDPGKNTVIVEAYTAGKKVTERKIIFFYQVNPLEAPPEGFKRFVMHTAEKEALCAGCHTMNPTSEQYEMVGADNPCASCHKRMLDHKNVHGPAGAFQCSYCHDAGSRPAKYQARKSDIELCAECHLGKIDAIKQSKKIHGPVALGLCSLCHDSHASANPAQILLPVNQLCLTCHEGIDKEPHAVTGMDGQRHPLDGVSDPSRPGHELSCVGCHDPHAGVSEYLFVGQVSSRFSLCQKCHLK